MIANPSLKSFVAFWSITFLFIYLFYKEGVGLNLLLYEIALLLVVHLFYPKKLIKKIDVLVQSALLTTALMVVIHHTSWSIWVNFLFGLVFLGRLGQHYVKSLYHSFFMGLHSLFFSWGNMMESFVGIKSGPINGRRIRKLIKIIFIPTIIILIFMLLYSVSSPSFANFIEDFFHYFDWVEDLLELINPAFLGLLIVALFIHVAAFFYKSSSWLEGLDKNGNDELKRRRKSRKFLNNNGLKIEFKAGVFLIMSLNLMLLLVNYFDIRDVWFGFNFEGEYLKDYVHYGTIMLVISIIISILIVLYYFRGNLNFYSKNAMLKKLSYLWIFQNAILTISVAVRTFHYITYYNLAYRRIALLFFLALVLFGLASLFVKVWKRKSRYYLLKVNGLACFIILLFSTLFEWNGIIASHNISNYEKAFVHFDFLSNMDDSTLDDFELSPADIQLIKKVQYKNFPKSKYYLGAEEFFKRIHDRQDYFVESYPQRNILSWNYAEYKVYQKFKK